MSSERFRDRRILVVDDEERMVRFIRLNLEYDQFQGRRSVQWDAGYQ